MVNVERGGLRRPSLTCIGSNRYYGSITTVQV
jgi:hypothetical protein